MPWSRPLVGCTLLIGLAAGGASLANIWPGAAATDQATKSATSVVNVKGMFCAGCAVAVKMVAGKVDGVINVDVSLEEKRAQVTYDPAKTTPSAIAAAITAGTGFEADPQPATLN